VRSIQKIDTSRDGTLSLTLNTIDVPAHRVVGDKATLICQFDMEGDTLYSVKWYKNDHEFYRWVPNDRPKLQVFKTEGIQVDQARSTKQQVVLTNLSLASGGTYKCEVSAEAPSFRTKFAKQDMVVVVLPTKAEIIGVQPKYQVGDTVNVTCYSYRSRPAASLTWRVNGKEVNPNGRYDSRYDHPDTYEQYPNFYQEDQMMGSGSGGGRRIASSTRGGGGMSFPEFVGELIEFKPKVETVGSERLETSALGLTFQVKPKYVKHGLKLECTASIGSVYWQSFQDSPKVSPREQPAISGNWWTSSHASSCYSFTSSLLGLLFVLTWLF